MHRAAALPVSTGPVCHWTSHCPRRRSCCPGSGGARADPSGPWWTKNNGAIITVAPCAAFIAYCGILLLLKESRGLDV
jgi:hypothetical protein